MAPEELIKLFIEDIGLRISDIPRVPDVKTPDFLIQDDKATYVLELKSKFPNPSKQAERNKSFERGALHEATEPIVPQNRLSGIIGHAKKQLDVHVNDEQVFRLLWLYCGSHLAEAHFEQFHSSLYGSTSLVDWAENGKSGTVYYFYNSDYFRFKDSIDGAFISTSKKMQFCLNTYSPRYESLKRSELIKKLPGGIIDPFEEEKEGNGFIVDTDVNRNDRATVTDFIIKKYGLSNMTKIMDMNYYSGTVQVKLD